MLTAISIKADYVLLLEWLTADDAKTGAALRDQLQRHQVKVEFLECHARAGFIEEPLGSSLIGDIFDPSVKSTARLMAWRYQFSLPVNNCARSDLLSVLVMTASFLLK
jgi:hypothetical protein